MSQPVKPVTQQPTDQEPESNSTDLILPNDNTVIDGLDSTFSTSNAITNKARISSLGHEQSLIGPSSQMPSVVDDTSAMNGRSRPGSDLEHQFSGQIQQTVLYRDGIRTTAYWRVLDDMPTDLYDGCDIRSDFASLMESYKFLLQDFEHQLSENDALQHTINTQGDDLHHLKERYRRVENDLHNEKEDNKALKSENSRLEIELANVRSGLQRSWRLQSEGDEDVHLAVGDNASLEEFYAKQIEDLQCSNAELRKELAEARAQLDECNATLQDVTEFLQVSIEATNRSSLEQMLRSLPILPATQNSNMPSNDDNTKNVAPQPHVDSGNRVSRDYEGSGAARPYANSNPTEQNTNEVDSRASIRETPENLGFMEGQTAMSNAQSESLASRSVTPRNQNPRQIITTSPLMPLGQRSPKGYDAIVATYDQPPSSGSLIRKWILDQDPSQGIGQLSSNSPRSHFSPTGSQQDMRQGSISLHSNQSELRSSTRNKMSLKAPPKNVSESISGGSTDAASINSRSGTNPNTPSTTLPRTFQNGNSQQPPTSNYSSGSGPPTPRQYDLTNQIRVIGSSSLINSAERDLNGGQDQFAENSQDESIDLYDPDTHPASKSISIAPITTKDHVDDEVPLSSTSTVNTLSTLASAGVLVDRAIHSYESSGSIQISSRDRHRNTNTAKEAVDDSADPILEDGTERHGNNNGPSPTPRLSDSSSNPSVMTRGSQDNSKDIPMTSTERDTTASIELWALLHWISAFWRILLKFSNPVFVLIALSDLVESVVDHLLAVSCGQMAGVVLFPVEALISEARTTLKQIFNSREWWFWANLTIAMCCLWLTIIRSWAHQNWYTANTSNMRETVMAWREDHWDHKILRYLRWCLELAIERRYNHGDYLILT